MIGRKIIGRVVHNNVVDVGVANTQIGTYLNFTKEVQTYLDSLSEPIASSDAIMLNEFIERIKVRLGLSSISDFADAIYWLSAPTGEASLKNIVKRQHDAILSGNSDFIPYLGHKGNGVSVFINTNYNPKTQGVNYTLNDASVIIYSESNLFESKVDVGVRQSTSHYSQIYQWVTGGLSGHRMHQSSATSALAYETKDTRGVGILTRDGNTLSYYQDFRSYSDTIAVTDIPSNNYFILARNNGTSAELWNTKRLGIVMFTKGVTQEQANILSEEIYRFRRKQLYDTGFSFIEQSTLSEHITYRFGAIIGEHTQNQSLAIDRTNNLIYVLSQDDAGTNAKLSSYNTDMTPKSFEEGYTFGHANDSSYFDGHLWVVDATDVTSKFGLRKVNIDTKDVTLYTLDYYGEFLSGCAITEDGSKIWLTYVDRPNTTLRMVRWDIATESYEHDTLIEITDWADQFCQGTCFHNNNLYSVFSPYDNMNNVVLRVYDTVNKTQLAHYLNVGYGEPEGIDWIIDDGKLVFIIANVSGIVRRVFL